jgi:type III pantothenate kinase
MFLAIDAGNSNVVFGLYDETEKIWINQFRLETEESKLISQLSKKLPTYFLEHTINPSDISAIGFSSVVPEINPTIKEFCENYFGITPYTLTPKSYKKLPIKTLRPTEIGSDLMCNVMAAFTKTKKATLIIDFGTALTFTTVDGQGEILGINIAPGLRTAIKSLSANTSKLPEVALKLPKSALGKNTVHAIQAGVLYGYIGLVKGMIETIEKETQLQFHIIATGGLSSVLTPLKEVVQEIDKNLTLEGLRLITVANS